MTVSPINYLQPLSVFEPGSHRLAPAAGVRGAIPGLNGSALRHQPGGDLRGHEAGAGCSGHP